MRPRWESTSAAGEHQTLLTMVKKVITGMVTSRPASAIQSEPSPLK